MQRGKTFEDSSIGNFVFTITPTEAHFNRPSEHKRTLTLQKGMQTLGTLEQTITIISKQRGQLKHKFQPGASGITFRVINDKNLNYQWTVYKVLDGGQLQEIDSMQFSIQSFWKSYIGEYEKNVANLNLRIKDEKEQKKMLQAWKQISSENKQKTSNFRVTFPKAEFRLDFQIAAKSILDEQLEEYEKQKLLRKLRQLEKSQIRKSAITFSNIGLQDELTHEEINLLDKIKRTKTEEGDKLNVPNFLTPNRNFLLPIQQRHQHLKKNHSHNEAGHRPRFSDEIQTTLSIESSNQKILKRASSFEKRESAKQFEREENLQLSSKINSSTIHKVSQTRQPENKKVQSIKMTILYIVLGIGMLWLLYNLMGHTSKVEYKKK